MWVFFTERFGIHGRVNRIVFTRLVSIFVILDVDQIAGIRARARSRIFASTVRFQGRLPKLIAQITRGMAGMWNV